MKPIIGQLSVLFIAVLTLPHSSHTLYFEEVANLTSAQRNTLGRFRQQVEGLLPHSYMKEDLYLARFLRVKNYRLRDAVAFLKEALEWRRINSMDSIGSEDFSEFEPDFPLFFDGVDKEGRVIMEANFGDWPIRTAVIAGKLPRLKRYGVKAIEDATKKVRELQEIQGKNITQWVMLLNMDGFTVIESACPSCLPYYLNFVTSYEKYYPFSVGHVVFVNTPEAFEIVMNLIRPAMNIQTRRVMKIFGTNERTWRPYLEKYFDYSQIGDWFGGHKQRSKQ